MSVTIITEIILKTKDLASAKFCYEQSVELASVFDSAPDNADTSIVPPEVDLFGAATAAPLESVAANMPSASATSPTSGTPSLHRAAGLVLCMVLSAVAFLLL